MNKVFIISLVVLSTLLFSFHKENDPSIMIIEIPNNWPDPIYDFKKNPVSNEGFELGRQLFYDPILSRDSSISCASCHLQYTGFTHVDHKVSHGIEDRKGTRNSPALINLAWQKHFHWDGGVNHIEVQGLNPITHPAEMDNSLEEVIRRLSQSEKYVLLFNRAYGEDQVNTQTIMKALSQFTVSLVSNNSKYDRVMRKEKGVTFTDQEKKGLKLFRKNCTACHSEPLFMSTNFYSNGLKPDPELNDLGRYNITKNPKDSFLFKVPSLRNIEYTFPYMHDGRYRKLKDVVNYYSDEIDPSSSYLSPLIKGPFHFTEHEKKDLLAFLFTLTDKDFLYNKQFSFPKN